MKEKYEAPVAEKIEFNYEETVVASNTSSEEFTPSTPVASYQNQNKCRTLNNNNANKCVG